jgi:hypothetical protein
MSIDTFEEEEFETQFNGQTVLRILKQALPYWPMLVGFLVAIALVALNDAIFTYISKLIIDNAILALSISPAFWANASDTICGAGCSTICKGFPFPILTARL